MRIFLSAEQLSKSYHDHWLFQGLSLGISQGEKLALVGENGAGKSTLLKILSGEVSPDTGVVSLREGIRVGFLRQQPEVNEDTNVSAILFPPDNEVAKIVRQYDQAIKDPHVSAEKMQALQEKMEEYRAWDYEARVKDITTRLGITSLDERFGNLSGGERKRLFLAQMLLSEPDLILLDEPTNHLDLEAIEWLETYLSGANITLLMVTHDRYFLDQVATEILELDNGQLYRYKGNYTYFLEKKTAREEVRQAEVDRARNLMRKELEWMRRQPKARGTKSKSRIEAFHELKETASRTFDKGKLKLSVKESRQGGKVLECRNVSKSYGERSMVRDFTYTFKKQERIGIVGKNGVGKSTFLDLLTGRIAPDSGKITPGLTTRFGYFTQEASELDPGRRVIEEVTEIAEFITMADGSQIPASRFLEMFLFPREKQYTFISKLSGGERKRLQLLKVLVQHPNFLILDEPTNDFDISALNVLEDFLQKFTGCLMLVSHDRYFMDHLVDQLFVFEGDGRIRIFNGNYSAYRNEQDEIREKQKQREVELKKQRAAVNKADPPESVHSERPDKKSKKKLSYREKQEYEQLESIIESLEAEKNELIRLMETGESDYEQLQEYAVKIEKLSAEIDDKTFRWLELDELAD